MRFPSFYSSKSSWLWLSFHDRPARLKIKKPPLTGGSAVCLLTSQDAYLRPVGFPSHPHGWFGFFRLYLYCYTDKNTCQEKTYGSWKNKLLASTWHSSLV